MSPPLYEIVGFILGKMGKSIHFSDLCSFFFYKFINIFFLEYGIITTCGYDLFFRPSVFWLMRAGPALQKHAAGHRGKRLCFCRSSKSRQ